MLELTRNGYHDEACRPMDLRTCPSWGYMIDQGATTMWERWDGFVKDRGFYRSSMNSFNHWALGSVGEWIWRHIAGLNPDEEHPCYEHFVIKPQPGPELTWARSRYDSIRGPILSDWAQTKDGFSLKVTVPANTTATVHIPAGDVAHVTEGDQPATQAVGREFLGLVDGCAVFNTQSGTYVFKSQ